MVKLVMNRPRVATRQTSTKRFLQGKNLPDPLPPVFPELGTDEGVPAHIAYAYTCSMKAGIP